MNSKLKGCGCLFLLLVVAVFAISREGQAILGFFWTVLTWSIEVLIILFEKLVGLALSERP